MASFSTLPSDLHPKLFETIPKIKDLISLLHASSNFAALFRRYYRSLLSHVILPRINPHSPDAVASALQAACSGGTLYCRIDYPGMPPPEPLARQKVAESWFLPHEHNIWHASYANDPLLILLVLRDLERETKDFRRLISSHRHSLRHKRPPAVSRNAQQTLIWELQAQTLRCANTESVRWHGSTSASPRERAETVLHASFLQLWDGLNEKERCVLVAAGKVAGECARRVRALLVLPPREGLLFRMVFGLRYDALRVAGQGGKRDWDWVQSAVEKVEREEPGRIGLREREQYRLYGREVRRQDSEKVPHKKQLKAGASPSRIDRIRANLASYLDTFAPLTSSGSIASIGEFYGPQVRGLDPRASALEKHLGLVANMNFRTAGSDKDVMEDVEDILPDVTECMNAAVQKWARRRRREKKYGITLRPELRGNLD